MEGRAGGAGGCDVLLLTASLGRGHRQVARALTEAFAELHPGLRLRTTDEEEILGPALHRLVRGAYAFSLRHWQAGFDWFYRASAALVPGSRLHRALHGVGQRRLLRILQRWRPDVVVCTFPEQAGGLSALRHRGLAAPRTAVVVTDHSAHSHWVHPGLDLYCAPSESVAAGLVRRGCTPGTVAVTGIPVRRAFRHLPSRAAVRDDLRLPPDLPAALVTPGPFDAAGPAIEAGRAVLDMPFPSAALVVMGDRRAERRALRALGGPPGAHVFGFVRHMERLMVAADLLVGKAGGVTTAEALSCGLPMLLYRPAPGQERQNTAMLVSAGAAEVAMDGRELREALGRILGDPGRLAAMREAARSLAAPGAARDAASRILALLPGARYAEGPGSAASANQWDRVSSESGR